MKPDIRSSLSITWEFKTIERDGKIFTDAVMIIHGEYPQRHNLGLFPGRLDHILKTAPTRKEMEGGTLSGFITFQKGGGEEVLVRYNEHLTKLIIVTRQVIQDSAAGSYKTFMVIPLKKPHAPNTGF